MTLTPSEAAKVLATAKLVDNRQFDEATAIAWAQMLEPSITLREAIAAVARHFATSTDYLMPAHVNQIVKAVRAERRALIHAAGPPDFPDDLTYAQEQVYRRRYHELVGDGMTRDDAQAAIDRERGFTRRAVAPVHATYRYQLAGTFRQVPGGAE
jgi:hypothetical protein